MFPAPVVPPISLRVCDVFALSGLVAAAQKDDERSAVLFAASLLIPRACATFRKASRNTRGSSASNAALRPSRGVLGFHGQPKAKAVQEGAETLQAGVPSLG